MKNSFLFLEFLLICGNVHAQCSGQIFLPDQITVDNFLSDYDCTTIDGE